MTTAVRAEHHRPQHRRRFRRLSAATALALVCTVALLAAGIVAGPADASAVQSSRVIGTSVQGRSIVAYRLGNPFSATKAVIVGSMHGNEKAGVVLARSLLARQQAVTNIDLWIIPTMNPDGYAANTRGNAHHVDLNRNWPDDWIPLSGSYYSGPAPSSEPETKAMYAFLKTVNPRYLVVLHQPLYGVDTTDGGARDPGFRHRLSYNLGLPEKAFNCWSVCHGSMTGWMTHNLRGAAITVEFGSVVSSTYLTSQAAIGVVRAMGGGFAPLSSRNPGASISVTAQGSRVTVRGWALDLDAPTTALPVTIFDGTRKVAGGRTLIASPDVNSLFHVTGTHRFSFAFDAPNAGHTYCVVVANVGAGSAASVRKCAAALRVDGSPRGHLDVAMSSAPGVLDLAGWALDPDATATSIQVIASIDGVSRPAVTASLARADVNATLHVNGDHGFALQYPDVTAGDHVVCVTALNIGWSGAPNRSLGCRTLTVAAPA